MIDKSSSAGMVSVMMPVYNAECYLRQSIESVLSQNLQNWELIIVNDGSTDKSREIAESFDDRRICVFHQANAGEAAARNHALNQMSGEFVAFLDADDAWLPDHLSCTVDFLNNHVDMDGVYTDGYHIDEDNRRLQTLSSRRRGPFTGWIFEQIVRASDVFGPPMCVLLRRNHVLNHLLDFDPAIVIGPDWDFFTRYCESTQFGYVDQKTCLYRIHKTNITVQTDLKRRAAYLARCREKAIHLPRFSECTLETREAVFYDLLINLLSGRYEKQAEVFTWPQFLSLPDQTRARLLRLAVTSGIVDGQEGSDYLAWMKQAARLGDRPARWLLPILRLHPALLRFLLNVRNRGVKPQRVPSPFGDIRMG